MLSGVAATGCTNEGDPITGPLGDQWLALYGGSGGESMEGLLQLPDDTFLIAGQSESFSGGDNADALLVKLTANGVVEWAKTYGADGDDMLVDVQVAEDGGLWAVGWTTSFGAEQSDFWVVRLDAEGEAIWAKAYGGSGTEQAWSVATLSDGGIAVTGGSTSFGAGAADLWLLRLDADGDILWQNAYGGSEDDAGGGMYGEYTAHVVAAGDGDLVLGTGTLSFGAEGDLWLLEVDDSASGSVLWEYSYGAEDEDSNWSFSPVGADGFLMTGSYAYTDPVWDADAWVVRLNADGSVRWQKTYGLAGQFDEVLREASTSDGGGILGGYYEVSDQDWRASLIKVGADGSLQWAQEYHPGALDWVNAVQEIDGGYMAIGVSTLDLVNWDEQLLAFRVDESGSTGEDCPQTSPLSLDVKDTWVIEQPTTATVTGTVATVLDTPVNAEEVTVDGNALCDQ